MKNLPKDPKSIRIKPKEYPQIVFAGISIKSTTDGCFLEQAKGISQIATLKQETDADELRTTRDRLELVSHGQDRKFSLELKLYHQLQRKHTKQKI